MRSIKHREQLLDRAHSEEVSHVQGAKKRNKVFYIGKRGYGFKHSELLRLVQLETCQLPTRESLETIDQT